MGVRRTSLDQKPPQGSETMKMSAEEIEPLGGARDLSVYQGLRVAALAAPQ